MAPIPHAIALALFAGGAIAWLVGTKHFIAISNELARARRAGEARHIPSSSRGLPIVVLLSDDALPKASESRRKFVRALVVFLGFGLALLVLIIIWGPHH
jgi:hypothetical protein